MILELLSEDDDGSLVCQHQENSSLLKPTENLLKLLISVDFSRIFSVAVYLFK